jgi:hypothetical protein
MGESRANLQRKLILNFYLHVSGGIRGSTWGPKVFNERTVREGINDEESAGVGLSDVAEAWGDEGDTEGEEEGVACDGGAVAEGSLGAGAPGEEGAVGKSYPVGVVGGWGHGWKRPHWVRGVRLRVVRFYPHRQVSVKTS